MAESQEITGIGFEATEKPEDPRIDAYAGEYFTIFSKTFPEATSEQRKKFLDLAVNFAKEKITIEDEAKKLITTDSLVTNVLNHGRFLDALDNEIKATEHMPEPSSYLLGLDLDYFNKTNEAIGHPKADELLKELGRVLVDATREGDSVGRTGGDEFSIILRRADEEVAKKVARRIQEASINELKKFSTGDFQQTISIGLCLIPRRLAIGQVRDLADAALYTVKNSGRNQIAMGSFNPETNSIVTSIIPSEPVLA